MPESTAEEPWWVESLSRILRGTEPRAAGPLTVIELADEIGGWVTLGRSSAWRRNRSSLRAELGATRSDVAGWGDPATLGLLAEIGALLADAAVLDSAARDSIQDALQRLRRGVTSDEAIRAQGSRLIAMAGDDSVPLAHLAMARELLDDQIDLRGGDPRYVLLDALWKLESGRSSDHPPDSLDARVALFLDGLTMRRDPASVIVWLVYEDAEINPGYVIGGPLAFFSGRWAVAGARANGPHDFPNRADVAAYLASPGSGFSDPTEDQGKVLVRVDLGVRQTHRAFEDAAEMVTTVLDVAVDRVSGVRWKPHGAALMEVNGDFLGGGVHRFGEFDLGDTQRLDIEETGGEVARWTERLGPSLSRGPIPDLLHDALSLAAARRSIEDATRNHPMPRLNDRNLRIATAMDDQIVEAVAGWAAMEVSDLEDALRSEWIQGRWQGEIGQTLQVAIWEARRREGAPGWHLERALSGRRDGREVLLLGRALEHEHQILDALKDPHDRRRGEVVIAALRAPDAFALILHEGTEHLDLDVMRARRARNAVAHGNPVSTSVIARSRPLARFLASGAIDLALRAVIEGIALPDFIEQVADRRENDLAEFHGGTPWSIIWARSDEA